MVRRPQRQQAIEVHRELPDSHTHDRQKDRLDFEHKGPPATARKGLKPWFEAEDPAWEGTRIVFGHWSALGLVINPRLICVDTGCVWGRQLTAVQLGKRPKVTQVRCSS